MAGTDGGQHASLSQQQQQQQHTDQPVGCSPLQAWRQGRLTLSFSGGGFLLPYHLGVYQSLAAMGVVSRATPMAGSSAGSLVVGAIKSGLSLQQQMDSCVAAAHNCKEHGINSRLRKVLKAQLNQTLPPDAAERCSDGTCWISLTQVFPRPSNKLYGGFSSRQQLIKALLASCHLPRLSDGGLFTSYKSLHKRVFDGGFSNLNPVPPVLPQHDSTEAAAAVGGLKADATTSSSTRPTALPTPNTAAGSGIRCSSSSSNERGSGGGGDAGNGSMQQSAGNPGVGASSHAEPRPTAPAAAVLLHRSDSTKGISTKLNHTKGRGGKHLSNSSSSRSFSRSLSAPEVALNTSNGSRHSLEHSSSTSSSHKAHAGFRLHSVLLPNKRRQQQHQQQQQQQCADAELERLLAAGCEVSGPQGAYVAAEGWVVVRVSLLPARHLHELPVMFRAPAADEVSIALDKFQTWPHDLNATTNLALFPPDDDFLWDLFRRGQQDGVSWAAQQGFPQDMLQRLPHHADQAEELRVCRSSSAAGEVVQQQDKAATQSRQQQQEQEQAAVVAAARQGMQELQAAAQQGAALQSLPSV